MRLPRSLKFDQSRKDFAGAGHFRGQRTSRVPVWTSGGDGGVHELSRRRWSSQPGRRAGAQRSRAAGVEIWWRLHPEERRAGQVTPPDGRSYLALPKPYPTATVLAHAEMFRTFTAVRGFRNHPGPARLAALSGGKDLPSKTASVVPQRREALALGSRSRTITDRAGDTGSAAFRRGSWRPQRLGARAKQRGLPRD
jgi:hypothetical protein